MPGTITHLQSDRKNPKRPSILLNGTVAFPAHVDAVIRHELHAGQALSAETPQAVLAADAERKAYDRAVTYLGHKPRTEHEVRQKLWRAGYDPDAVTQVISTLCAQSYLDDAAYAECYVAARFRNHGFGLRRLRAELRRRGVAAELIDSALAQLSYEDIIDGASWLVQKYGPRLLQEPSPHVRMKKLMDYLRLRGYDADVARLVIDQWGHQHDP